MIHAFTLLLILLFAAPLAAQVPLAVLAGLLFVVAYNMGEWHEIPSLLKMTKADIAVWLATFALTVVADLTVAVEVGMVLAALLFIRRVANTTSVARVTGDLIEEGSAPLAAGGGDSRLCGGLSHSWPVSVRCDRQADGHPGSPADAAADRHRAASPRAGDGCIGTPGARGSRRSGSRRRAARCCCAGRASSRRISWSAPSSTRMSGDENILPNVQAALKRARAIAVELDPEQQRELTLAGTKMRTGD